MKSSQKTQPVPISQGDAHLQTNAWTETLLQARFLLRLALCLAVDMFLEKYELSISILVQEVPYIRSAQENKNNESLIV